MNKKGLSERDICTKYITPSVVRAGWDLASQIREELYFTNGRIIVRGKLVSRAKGRRADYILYHKPNYPIAIIEAKDNNHTVGGGMQQALDYAETLDIPFVYSSNGDAFLEHDRTGKSNQTEREINLDNFPSPEELWSRYRSWKGIDSGTEQIVTQDYHVDGSGKEPRYYQRVAINRVVEAIAQGHDRLLLVMATGTGKTYTAFQIIHRLWKARVKKRILFLADRNILVDQTKKQDFQPFGQAMHKITNRKIDKSYEVYLALYQAITGTEEDQKVYKSFSPDFFDLIIIDECHRGSAAEDSAWREILEYFKSAAQIGMTATPKETEYVSNIDYFGKPIYTYSLRQGIEDGFLAPYKVIRIDIDKDMEGWRPTQGMRDKRGQLIEDRIYNQRDMDRQLVLEKRTALVAGKVTQFLQETDPYDKTIVFCEDIDHSERMRQSIVNANPTLSAQNRKYVMRITGDNPEGKDEIDNFIAPEERYPVIATTSKLLSTGVDTKTCKVIALDKSITSMTEFKQIIGRGTRILEDYGKMYFTIIDFRKATELFADPDFDGDPVSIYKPGSDDPVSPPDETGDGTDDTGQGEEGETIIDGPRTHTGGGGGEPVRKYFVDNVEVKVLSERVQYLGPDGKLITESLKDYTRSKVNGEYASLNDFLKHWTSADRKEAIIEELEDRGVFWAALAEEVGKGLDPFDLIAHVVYGQPPLTRKERADSVRKRDYFTKYGVQARAVLDALLDKYADEGIANIESMNVLKLQPINEIGTPLEIVELFGGRDGYMQAIRELENHIYGAA